jgi:hypothetical protein
VGPPHLDLEAINRRLNQDDATEEGAEAITLLVAMDRTEFEAVERASTTTGNDYWLGLPNLNRSAAITVIISEIPTAILQRKERLAADSRG